MACPKCGSMNVTPGTAETYHCEDCNFDWVPYNTAPRLPAPSAAGMGIGVIIWPVILLAFIVLAFSGVLPWLLAVGFSLLAILGAIVMQFSSRPGK